MYVADTDVDVVYVGDTDADVVIVCEPLYVVDCEVVGDRDTDVVVVNVADTECVTLVVAVSVGERDGDTDSVEEVLCEGVVVEDGDGLTVAV